MRISLCEYNTAEDAEHIIRNVPEVVTYLRDMSPVWHDLEEGKRNHVI